MRNIDILRRNNVNVDKALEFFGDQATYDESLEDFIAEIGPKIDRLKKNNYNQNMASYAIDVHSLKSDSRYFGFDTLADMALEHEMKAKAGDSTFVSQNFDALMNEVYRVIKIIELYTGRTTPIIKEEKSLEVNSGSKIIYVVDDSDIVGNFIKRAISDLNVKHLKDGSDVLNLLKAGEYDNIAAMFLDLNMPGVNGFDVLEFLKNNMLFMKIPVVIITGAEEKDTIAKAFEYPIIDVLSKPFSDSNVKAILDKIKSLNL